MSESISAYTALIQRLADECPEPYIGVTDSRDLPDLTDAELAVVLRLEPDLLAEAIDKATVLSVTIALEQAPATPDMNTLTLLGSLVIGALKETVKAHVLSDVHEEQNFRALDTELYGEGDDAQSYVESVQ